VCVVKAGNDFAEGLYGIEHSSAEIPGVQLVTRSGNFDFRPQAAALRVADGWAIGKRACEYPR